MRCGKLNTDQTICIYTHPYSILVLLEVWFSGFRYGCHLKEAEITVTEKTPRGPVRTKADITTTQPTVREPDLYERFLELPVPIVLLSMWLAGAVLMGLGALMLYHLCRWLLWGLAGM